MTSEGLIDLSHARRGRLRCEWEALARSVSPFLGPDPVTVQARLAPEGERLVAVARSEGRLVGLLPVIRRDHTLVALRSLETPVYDFLGDERGAHRLLDVLAREDGWAVMSLTDLPAESPLVAAARAHGLLAHAGVHEHRRAPWLELHGFEQRLSTKYRANLRRCERKLPGLAHERIARWDSQAFADAVRIEALAWKEDAGSAIRSHREVERAYRTLCRWGARRGHLALHFLVHEGRRIASMMAFEDRDTVYALKLGHDPEYNQVSAGQLMIFHFALDAEQRGFRVLDFLGRDDEWKHKWTETTRSFVTLDFYRASLEGLARWVVEEELKPQVASVAPKLLEVARNVRDHHALPCQRRSELAAHPPLERLIWASGQGTIRSGLKEIWDPPPRAGMGKPSRFSAGELVRVKSREEISATLDQKDRLRGLWFVPAQWDYCGQTFRVRRQLRRVLDDKGHFRAIGGTVILDGVDCGGKHGVAGCGRHCPLWFRDEWLEPAEATDVPAPKPAERHATVRSEAEIRATLDREGRCDGVLFTSEIAAFTGRRLPVEGAVQEVFEHEQWLPPRAEVLMLEGARCTGCSLGEDGPCHRACPLLFHRSWLEVT